MRFDMADTEAPVGDSHFPGNAKALAGEDNARLAAGFRTTSISVQAIPPRHPVPRALTASLAAKRAARCSYRRRWLCAHRLLGRREDAIEKMLAVIVGHFANAGRFNDVDAVTDD